MTLNDFKDYLKKMDFLNLAAREYVDAFLRIIAAKHDSLLERSPKILSVILILQHALNNKSVCVRFDKRNNNEELNNLYKIIEESYITDNFSYLKKYKGDDLEEQIISMKNTFKEFWKGSIDEILRSNDCSWYEDFNNFLCNIVDEGSSLDFANSDSHPTPLVICKSDNNALTVYFCRQYFEETEVSKFIENNISINSGLIKSLTENAGLEAIKEHLDVLFNEKHDGIDWQKVAAATACISNFTVITGGPGTGKTTTVVKLLFLLLGLSLGKQSISIGLTAPTGKAANRMKESIVKALHTNDPNNKPFQALSNHYDLLKSKSIEVPNSLDQFIELIPTESSTIHKILGINPVSQIPRFNKENKLPYDVLIVDEASMIDLHLFYLLISALKPNAKLILLGDKDQLPSVEAGSVLSDICKIFLSHGSENNYYKTSKELIEKISGEKLPNITEQMQYSGNVAKLVESRRFVATEGIGKLANIVNNFQVTDKDKLQNLIDEEAKLKEEDRKVEFIDIASSSTNKKSKYQLNEDNNIKLIFEKVKDKYNSLFDKVRDLLLDEDNNLKVVDLSINSSDSEKKAKELFAAYDEFRLLCSNRVSGIGIDTLNSYLDKNFYKNKNYLKQKIYCIKRNTEGFWYPGLPIMITKNNYSLNLFNGDIGITMVSTNNHGEKEVQVLFQMSDGSFRYYPTSLLTDYELAYAMTIHKSQGSEAEHVVVITQNKDTSFITKEILYTGITRAKKKVTLVGTIDLLAKFCSRKIIRSSNLENRLLSKL